MTKEKFEGYLRVQSSGITNMFAVNNVIQLADQLANVELTRKDCFDIMKNFSKYEKEYKIKEA